MIRKLAAVATGCLVALVLADCTSAPTVSPTTTTKPLPAIDLSATPAGWVPVAYGDAQVSVPASFSVYYTGENTCGSYLPTSSLFIGPNTGVSAPCDVARARPNRTVVRVVPANGVPSPYDKEKPVTINGFLAFPAPAGRGLDYYVPLLGVEASATGPMASRVLATLTHSPRAVVLASGPAPATPSDWKTLTFQGLAFAAPSSWPVTRTSGAAFGLGMPCATPGVAFPNLAAYLVTLDTDTHFLPPDACPSGTPLNQPPTDGVQVDSGSRVNFRVALSFSTHCLKLHGLTACPATSPAYSILVLKVTVPRRSKPVYVSIGLAGSGTVARTILYSLWAA
jgi:hypothetical protein